MNKIRHPLTFSNEPIKYSYCTCNFYTGCNNACEYCCCINILKESWKNNVRLLYKSKKEALEKFKEQIDENKEKLKKYGIFFSLITDPLLKSTKDLTYQAINYCLEYEIPFKILTKCTNWKDDNFLKTFPEDKKHLAHFGFSLSGEDQFESNASSNLQRIDLMKKLYIEGFKTWVSAEPIINVNSSIKVLQECKDFCYMVRFEVLSMGHYKSDKLSCLYKKRYLLDLYKWVENNLRDKLIYWGDGFLVQSELNRAQTNSTRTGDLIIELNGGH
jgi:DNA repair photolyase